MPDDVGMSERPKSGDVVVTVPKARWAEWITEGDNAVDDVPARWWGDMEYGFTFGPGVAVPNIGPGDRVYVVAYGQLRGYAPLVKITNPGRFGGRPGGFALVRRGDAVACTIPEPIRGFQGWRYRWWERDDEIVFHGWKSAGVV